MADSTSLIRLHKRIADAGICSRRAAEKLIAEGRVQVNGETVTEMGVKVSPEDEVAVDGIVLETQRSVTLMMNKPVGYVCTVRDPHGRPTVMKLLPDLGVSLKPVGRLDMDSEGLLLFTTDGELANRLTHPRYEIDKEYEVIVLGDPDIKDLQRLERGIHLEDGKTAPAKVKKQNTRGGKTKLSIIIHEGRNRQVRRMFEAIGHPVTSLRRIRIGHLRVKGLGPGECQRVGDKDLKILRDMLRMD